jgi:N-acetylneuraminate synthase/N,N'-diacetyllegionaminate synthase
VFIVAEIGINHNGDLSLAKEEILAAAEAGADSVKFQNYHTNDFLSDRSLSLTYKSQGRCTTEPQYDLFQRCELSLDDLIEIKEFCDTQGVLFHSTPTSSKGVDDLLSIGCSVLKNGSDYLTNLDLIRFMGQTGLPTVLSTGMSTLAEIDSAVRTYRETDNDKLILLHCTSAYPAPMEEVNLARLRTLRDAFAVPVGFSDHTTGTTAAIASVILGSCWLEKHFTLDRTLPGPDHWFSMNPEELRVLVDAVREAEKVTGSPAISPTTSEESSRKAFRLSCVAARNIESGDILTRDDICFRRPGDGLPPSLKPILIGMQAKALISKGQPITKEHLHEPVE